MNGLFVIFAYAFLLPWFVFSSIMFIWIYFKLKSYKRMMQEILETLSQSKSKEKQK